MTRPASLLTALASLAATAIVFGSSLNADETIDFNRNILPLLSDRCFLCHGPDSGSNDSGFRLDSAEAATKELPSGEGLAIVPGDIASSVIVQRIDSTDESILMPPPDSNLSLSPDEKMLLRKWIEQGGEYKGHWAFEPLPRIVTVPEIADSQWASSSIDAFVEKRMSQVGLSPSPSAPAWQWLRRTSFDLTGLPPSPELVTQFGSNPTEGEYEKMVDRLLESPHFGEKMAVGWLDSARYADSYGYQSDRLNYQWPYRDWVVNAFNENLPYDQFLQWQLAGDLMPNPTQEQLLATTFNRLHRTNNEGGAVFEEWRVENVADRVHTFGTAMLGVTMECCRCHDHKFDPITMRDYYSMFAFFSATDDNGMYDRADKVPSPSMLLPNEQQQMQLTDAALVVTQAEQQLNLIVNEAIARYRDGVTSQPMVDSPWLSGLKLALDFDRPYDDSLSPIYFPAMDDQKVAEPLPLVDVPECEIARMQPSSNNRMALRLDGERGITTHGIEDFDRWTPFSLVLTFRETSRNADQVVLAQHTHGTDAGYNGWDLTLKDGLVQSRMYRVWPGNAIAIQTVQPLAIDQWHQIAATYDGSSSAKGLKLFLNGKPLETIVLRDDVLKSANVDVGFGGELTIGQRFRSRGFADGLIDDLRVFNRDLSRAELAYIATGKPQLESVESFVRANDAIVIDAAEKLAAARKAYVMLEESIDEIAIMRDSKDPIPAHILARGQYDAPKTTQTRVQPDTFESIKPAFPPKAPRNRLGLAQWLTQDDHPLTARVAVNRLWIQFFGTGLVKSADNFGRQGDLPTHPELLNWLARDLIDSGWDIKQLCKTIVLSKTYRQSSRSTPTLQEVDPFNKLLARGPSYRLSAEAIRDLSLAASGLLNEKAGGPPVSPYQAGGDLWRESNGMSPPYQQSLGTDLYRRSIYSVWKRTAPLPNMMAFDATPREVCIVGRSRTNTPLQALVLLNDVQFLEASRVIAQNVIDKQDTDVSRIHAAFLALTARKADDFELNQLQKLLTEERNFYSDNPSAAQKLIENGESQSKPDAAPELAAMTIVCQAILNLDATIWKR